MTENSPIPPPVQKRMQKQAPLSFSQESLWFLQQLDPYNNAYNSNYLFKFSVGVNRLALERALNDLVCRHEPLRTIYPEQGGKLVQVIQPYLSIPLDYSDFSALPDHEHEYAIHRYISEHSDQPYDLQHGPVVRFALLHTASNVDHLLVGIHHIGSDAWSSQIFFNELMQLYHAYSSGIEPVLNELPVQYSDFALWQREWLSGETLRLFVDHWKNVLSVELPILDLPTDHPRPAMQTYHGARHYLELQQGLSGQIQEFCRREHLTPFHFFMAAYAVLLMRHTGQDHIIMGCPFANRSRPELHGLVGLFVNTLPIQVNLQGNPTVRELLNQVRTIMLDALSWQAAPFEVLVSEISPARDLSRTPVFQVAINMRNVPRKSKALMENLKIEQIRRDDAPAPYDVSLDIFEEDGVWNVSFHYNLDLFNENTILHLATHYQNLLGEVLLKTDLPIAELEMLTPSERKRILFDWNNTITNYPREKLIHQLIEEQVERTPEKIALIFGNKQLTYREVNQRANKLSQLLMNMGTGPDIPVGVYLERSSDLIVAILGILKAGSPYVPLDKLYPVKRREEIIKDSGMRILVTQESLVKEEIPSGLKLLCLDALEKSLSTENEQNPENHFKSKDLAYIIYTSGSTGKPKGVEITHQSVVNCLLATQERLGLSAGDFSLTVTTPTFDVSFFELLAPLSMGATVAIATQEEVYDSFLLAKRIMELPLTWMLATPTIWQMLLDTGWPGKPGLKILTGGETLPVGLANHLALSCGEVFNIYGPTETTIFSSISRVLPGQIITIGRPIANIRMYILDSHRQPVPVGVAGELYIGGDGLARGYHNRPELNAEKFIPDPFSRLPGARLYLTGDLARYKPNGEIEFLGRMDNQVKIRGYRIELEEIEAALEECPDVRRGVVVVLESTPGDKKLVGFVIPAAGAILDRSRLHEYLKDKLPGYMIPTEFVFMEAFPITPNGKIDRKSLPVPRLEELVDREYVTPRTPTEQCLARIWMELLDVSRIGIADDFFNIGGNSLFAVRVVARIQNELGVTLPISKIFESPQLVDLAAEVDLELSKKNQPSVGHEVPDHGKEYVP